MTICYCVVGCWQKTEINSWTNVNKRWDLAGLTFSQTSPGFYMSVVKTFGKHRGKRRNCSSQAISPFSTVFSTHLESFLPFLSNLKLSCANSFSLEVSKICHLGKG